jgi:hypothetical protein
MQESLELVADGQMTPSEAAFSAVVIGDYDLAGELLLQAYESNDGTWTFPIYIRLPEQAPDSMPWQTFWALPGPAQLADIRRKNGLNAQIPGYGDGAR